MSCLVVTVKSSWDTNRKLKAMFPSVVRGLSRSNVIIAGALQKNLTRILHRRPAESPCTCNNVHIARSSGSQSVLRNSDVKVGHHDTVHKGSSAEWFRRG